MKIYFRTCIFTGRYFFVSVVTFFIRSSTFSTSFDFFDKLPEIFESFQKKKHVLTRVSNCDATGSAAENLITTVPADIISKDKS